MCVDSSKSKVSTDNVKKIAKIDVQFMKNIPLFKLLKDANLIFKERQPVFFSISKLYKLRITEVAFKLFNDRCWILMFSICYYLSVILARAYE